MSRKPYDMINEVLAHFDFERVHETMKALDWTWYNEGVPSIKELKESAEERMYSAIKQALDPNNTEHHDIGWISNSGGLKAMAWRNEDYTLARVQLEFVVTEWDAENDSEEAE